MKLLYGTGNQAKFLDMKQRLQSLHTKIQIVSLRELGRELPDVRESGCTPLENARLKAQAYYQAFQMPVFSCDTGLYFDRVPDEIQPGVHVRRVHGKNLTDQEMIAYYSGLAVQYGGLKAKYQNAVCLIVDEERRFEAMTAAMESREFGIIGTPHRDGITEEGFPLDCLSVDLQTGCYMNDLPDGAWMKETDGFLEFFRGVVEQMQL